MAQSVESACNVGDPDSIPGLGRFPAEGNGNPLQYSYVENSMDRGAWWAAVHGATKSRTRLSLFHDNLKANKYLLENGPSPDTIEVGHCRFIFLVCI